MEINENMNNIEAKEKFKKEKKVIFISMIEYSGKTYAKTLKQLNEGIEYVYYEIINDEIKEIRDNDILAYLQDNYNMKATDIIY